MKPPGRRRAKLEPAASLPCLGGHIDPDRAIDLAEGLVPSAELAPWLAHIASCPECEQLIRRYAGELDRIRERAADRRDPVAGPIRGSIPDAPAASTRRSSRGATRLGQWIRALPPWRTAGAAAIAAGVIVLAITLPKIPSPAPAYLLPVSRADVSTRGPSNSATESRVQEGLEAYARRDLDQARALLSTSEDAGRLETVRAIYLANIFALQGDLAEAGRRIAPLPLDRVPEPWRSESRWTLVAAWRAAGHQRRADSLLRAIASEPGPIGDRARAVFGRPAR